MGVVAVWQCACLVEGHLLLLERPATELREGLLGGQVDGGARLREGLQQCLHPDEHVPCQINRRVGARSARHAHGQPADGSSPDKPLATAVAAAPWALLGARTVHLLLLTALQEPVQQRS